MSKQDDERIDAEIKARIVAERAFATFDAGLDQYWATHDPASDPKAYAAYLELQARKQRDKYGR